MKLTGKCKEDFEKWYSIEFEKRNLPYSQGFDISDNSIKYGVYVDFFDSVGVNIWDYSTDKNKWYFSILSNFRFLNNNKNHFDTRNEARTEAIKKANEIYNN